MVAPILQRVPVDRITVEARDVHPVRFLLTLIAGVLYGVGWLAGKVLGAVFLAVVWSATAVKVGWQEARKPGGG